ncbi:MAG: type II secretion system major pseudopilin GspG [Burkholderiales bacterium]|nr:type II secretion system major pseudopilin GspG [Burkholderiales bacterium]
MSDPILFRRCPPRRRLGFTLLELLVVMVILGLLAAYVAPRYFGQVGKSEIRIAKAQIEAFAKALDQYRLDLGRYPSTDEGLGVLRVNPGNNPKWTGPYLQKDVPLDPWGHAYVYRAPGEHGEFDLISYGKDGRPGGTGEAQDITSW